MPMERSARGWRLAELAENAGEARCGRDCGGARRAGRAADEAAHHPRVSLHLPPEGSAAGDSRQRRRAPLSGCAAARRHRLGQNRGVSGGHAVGARRRAWLHSAGAGDRTDARRRRRSAQHLRRGDRHSAFLAQRRRARRAVAPHPPRRSAHRRGHALGDLRPGARPRAHHRRRGARQQLQAGGDAALSRPRCRRGARQGAERDRGAGLGHAIAGELPQRHPRQVRAGRTARPRAGASPARGGTGRHARGVSADRQGERALAQADRGDHGQPRPRRAGDDPAQPPRLLGVGHVPLLRRYHAVPRLRRGHDLSQAPAPPAVPLLRLPAAGAQDSVPSAAATTCSSSAPARRSWRTCCTPPFPRRASDAWIATPCAATTISSAC